MATKMDKLNLISKITFDPCYSNHGHQKHPELDVIYLELHNVPLRDLFAS